MKSDVPFSGQQVLLQKQGSPEPFADFKFYLNAGRNNFNGLPSFGNSGIQASSSSVPGDGNWHHVATTYDGISMLFYLDGTLRNTRTPVWGYVNGTAGPTSIGAGPAGDNFFAGAVDEMVLYNRPLTGDEVLALTAFSHNVPGDCNQDGVLDISDASCALGVLFTGAPFAFFPCGDGSSSDPGNIALMDWQPDGSVDLSDVVGMLQFLFIGNSAHPLAVVGSEVSACVPIMGCRANPNCE